MSTTEILAHIELNDENKWFIRVVDSIDKEGYICDNIDEFSFAITQLGAKHNNDISVKWSKDPDVTPKHFNEIEAGIRDMQKILDEQES
ncbi:MAG: hypothetical protein GX118_07635 [Arcobacter butzleri]|jgi:hypothetical protein|nr:hypothetical protein [Arcobacteraceae bacterium]MDY0364476.1 hypothetical protein [Arcobacteraceae bacterium]NLO18045.1 hypothetical protein [Aliarcobacter butzleri]